jgi:formylglycine-generating enzyme required for sulfatase activity
MVWIPAGTFRMGADQFYPEERPVRQVEVDGFWIDRCPVTNAQFAMFVRATGYFTVAERAPDPNLYPGALPELLVPGSLVFQATPKPVNLSDWTQWWRWVPGACWRHPDGPHSSIDRHSRDPVVHVAYEDVMAYCSWAGKSLPSEAEWERAARGGLDGTIFTWGNEEFPNGQAMANTWQGRFPWENLELDGYAGRSPVGAFPPNDYDLYDMAGNVWEWTDDWYVPHHEQPSSPCCVPHNPRGARMEESYDPLQPAVLIPRKVIKGGSHLCAPSYCFRYRPAARQPQMLDTSTSHLGFRCIVRGDVSSL